MKRFVCDFGFSSAKWIFANRQGRVISVYQDRSNGETFLGEDALDNPGGVAYIRTPQHLVKYYPLFLEKCLDEAGVQDDVKVGVGLPVQFYEEQTRAKEGAIAVLGRTLLSKRVKDVMVLPQGIGGIRSYLIDAGRNKTGLVLGIDIGFNTIIYTLYDPQRSKVVFTDTLYKRGIAQLAANYLMPKIADFTSGLSMTPVEVSRLMEQGFLTVGTDRHDLMPEIATASQEYITNILSEVMEDVKANISVTRPLETVVFFGGGATHLKGKICSDTVDVIILTQPEYANARGFMSFLEG
ncbi:ParM/StbA family protein [bacterium]|nr:ParM/StbA family protein [bacterium]